MDRMPTPNWRFRDLRIDDTSVNFTIDTTIPVRVDHQPISGITTTNQLVNGNTLVTIRR